MSTFSRKTSIEEALDPWYVTGFADADGSFTYSRSNGNVALYFAIKLTKQDESVLLQIQKFFNGAGSIYQVKPRTSLGSKSKSAAYYRITRYTELTRVIWHFNKYPLQSSKKESYKVWKEMVLLKQNFRRVPVEELEHLAIELSAKTPRNAPWDGY